MSCSVCRYVLPNVPWPRANVSLPSCHNLHVQLRARGCIPFVHRFLDKSFNKIFVRQRIHHGTLPRKTYEPHQPLQGATTECCKLHRTRQVACVVTCYWRFAASRRFFGEVLKSQRPNTVQMRFVLGEHYRTHADPTYSRATPTGVGGSSRGFITAPRIEVGFPQT